jgi:S-adenosylmethionine:tRNA ribosyltransferase-isomerase
MFASEFEFDLPDELIAQHPVEPRDRSRLMIVDRKRKCWEHRTFAELSEILDCRDVLVRNDTQVVPARLVGRRVATGGKWVGLFLHERPDDTWEMLAKTRGRPNPGEHVVVGKGLHLVLEGQTTGGSWVVRPERDCEVESSTLALLERHGLTPLPPYIRDGCETLPDRVAYQTVYARRAGSVAAPTAGLHFTEEVFTRLAARGIAWVDLTLHVGLGTFRPIEAKRLEDHVMHAEWAELSTDTIDTLNSRRRSGGRIVAVGTTSARVLETAATGDQFEPVSGETKIFIRPGHVFRGIDALVTNFHLPRSSLLVLVSALAGVELIRAAYDEAIRMQYRFFSYGDAMLIL